MLSRSKLCAVLAFAVACLSTQQVANANGFCYEGIDKKIANAETNLAAIRDALPTVPSTSADYFAHEYMAALDSGSKARLAAVENQPYFNEWTVSTRLSAVENTLRILKQAPDTRAESPYPSLAQERIYWASNLLGQLIFLEQALGLYVGIQQHLAQPMVVQPKLSFLTTTAVAYPLDQIIECELDKLKGTGPALKTYPR